MQGSQLFQVLFKVLRSGKKSWTSQEKRRGGGGGGVQLVVSYSQIEINII